MPPLDPILWLIPVLPLIGFLINGFGAGRIPGPAVAAIGLLGPLGAFVLSVMALLALAGGVEPAGVYFSWIQTADFSVGFGLHIDQLTAVMLLVITGVGSSIHLYSYGYMSDDPGIGRFFAYLNLFMCAMLLLVLGDNLLLMFVGWEGVGLCSYLLIGFWYEDLENADAGRKAFIVNRVGDLFFLLGMFTLFSLVGSIEFAALADALGHADLQSEVQNGPFAGYTLQRALQFAGICLFLGATGKSAQIPLYTWLPDAMAGPTPVSALIHAATMVTAGVYMIARLDFMFVHLPTVMAIIGLVAAMTATMAGLFALVQNDIKKILAYSTISQLGYMFAGVATTVFFAGVFHLVTHAFFKALLFLGAGAVIHSLEGEQDIRKMGGLRKDMKLVFVLFTIGSFALAGLPGLAGFFSKDEILASVLLLATYEGGMWGVTWWLLVFTAALTAFYTMRMLILTFFGPPADPHRHPHHVHWTMTTALVFLAILSAFAGGALLHIDLISLEHFTEPAWSHGIAHTLHETAHHDHFDAHWVALLYSVGAVGIGVVGAIGVYGFSRKQLADFVEGPGAQLHWLLENKFFVDEAYDYLFVQPVSKGAYKLWEKVDRKWIDGRMVEGPAKVTYWASGWLQKLQPGVVNAATSAVAAGSVVVLAYLFISGMGG